MVETCLIQLDGWSEWWNDNSRINQAYVSALLVILGIVVVPPITRLVFWTLRRFTRKSEDFVECMIQPTKWIVQAGLFWKALANLELTPFFCQWPLWMFGVPLLIFLNRLGDVIGYFIVRRGMVGYSSSKKYDVRKAVLRDGSLVLKRTILLIIGNAIYLAVFDIYLENGFGAVIIGLSIAIALTLSPLMSNLFGSIYLLFSDLAVPGNTLFMKGNPSGKMSGGSLAYIGLCSDDGIQTLIPAAIVMNTPLAKMNETVFPIRLQIKLSHHTASRNVRIFVQDLEQIMRQIHFNIDMDDNLSTDNKPLDHHRTPMGSNELTKRFSLFQKVQKHPSTHPFEKLGFVAVDGKWLIRVHSYTLAASKQHHFDIVSKVRYDFSF